MNKKQKEILKIIEDDYVTPLDQSKLLMDLFEEDECIEKYENLKREVEGILNVTIAGGHGGFVAHFGLVTYRTLVKLTGYEKENKKG